MNRQLEDTLIEALDLLDQGMPVTEILSNYPEMASELRPYLVTAADLNRLAEPSSIAAEQASKRMFLQYADELQHERRTPAAAWLQRILVSGLAVLFFLFLGSGMLAFTSGTAVPGDTLYGSKLFLERLRLNYSANPETAAAMIETFRQERVDEVTALFSLGRHEMVTFGGTVEDLVPGRWIVEGIPVAVTSSTVIHGEVEVGFLVQIRGMTGEGVVTADQVEVVSGRLPEPDPADPVPLVEPSPAPTIDPVNTPEQPDDAPETTLPSPTTTREDDLSGEDEVDHGDDGDPDGVKDGEDDSAQREGDAAGEDSPDDDDGADSGEESSDDGGDEGKKDPGDADSDEEGDGSESDGDESKDDTDESKNDDDESKDDDDKSKDDDSEDDDDSEEDDGSEKDHD